MHPEEPPRKRRFLQFSLRQLLVLFAVLGIFLAIVAPGFHRVYQEHQSQQDLRKRREIMKDLMLAIRNNDLSLARRALDAGSHPDAAFHSAVRTGRLAITELLLDFGADIERPGPVANYAMWDGPPLFEAITCDQSTEVRLQMIRLLLERGASPRTEGDGWNAMDVAVFRVYDGQVGDLLREYGVPYGPREMAAFNRLDELRRAVGEKPDLVKERLRTPWAHRPEQRSTLLGIALLKRYREMAKFLIEAGAPLDTREYAGLTPLHLAAGGGDPELIRLLVARGLDVNARDEDQTTPLHCILNYAGNPGDPDAFTTLIQAGADVNARTTRGGTPLPRAVDRNRVDIVRILVAAGADPTIAYTHDGQTALDMARRKKSELAKWPANRPLPDYYGDGVMSLDVARKKNAEIVKLLEEAVRAKPSSDGKSTK